MKSLEGRGEVSTYLKVFPASTEEESEGGGDAHLFYTTCPLCVTEEEEEKKEDVGRGGGGCVLLKGEDKNKRGVIQPRMAVPVWATL